MSESNIPDQMRSAQWTTAPIESSLKVNPTTPLPKDARSLPKDSALVRISFASLNPVDYKLPEFGPARFAAMGKGPWIPASDYAGTVVTTNLPHLKPGDKVAGCTAAPKFGTLAEYAVIEGAENVAKLPDGVDLKDAATLGVAAQTAMQCIAPYVNSGSKIIINGASGGTGTFGIQLARILGCTVTAICSGPNVELCKSLGADNVIDYKSTDVIEELKKDGLQYDLIVDNVTMAGPIYSNSHHYLETTGKYVTIAGGPDTSSLIGIAKMMAQPTWLGGGQRKAAFVGRKADSEELVKLAGWIKDGKLKPFIEKVYSLDQAGDAFERMKTGRTRGKLVIQVSGE
ncbi:NAD(P)-binding protein [Microthyrium microscopicum]|uniref:NAD(P)-binding protein n=1 Tax=Microthyrium microscopicum TaxID=703497 RepID=A0A6A6UBW3_9PEZI|nr:NAD(P)-binding protein [Microthyrium microscopicum]